MAPAGLGKPPGAEMNTVFLLLAQYGRTIVPAEDVRRVAAAKELEQINRAQRGVQRGCAAFWRGLRWNAGLGGCMPKTIHTPRDELVCGKLDALEDKGCAILVWWSCCILAADIRRDCERMEAKLISRKDQSRN
jgi:hypothetical protein